MMMIIIYMLVECRSSITLHYYSSAFELKIFKIWLLMQVWSWSQIISMFSKGFFFVFTWKGKSSISYRQKTDRLLWLHNFTHHHRHHKTWKFPFKKKGEEAYLQRKTKAFSIVLLFSSDFFRKNQLLGSDHIIKSINKYVKRYFFIILYYTKNIIFHFSSQKTNEQDTK